MCPLQNIAMPDYQEIVTTGQTDIRTDRRREKVIPMCRYALQVTQICTPSSVVDIRAINHMNILKHHTYGKTWHMSV